MAKKKENPASSGFASEMKTMIGPHLNFAASEAYKLLRTNLLFSFPADEKCHVLGITSTFQGEGKSLTAINISYTLAEANNRVLLIEGDMRIPNFANRLKLKKTPGLSTLLAGLDSISDAIQRISFRRSNNPDPVKFDVITAEGLLRYHHHRPAPYQCRYRCSCNLPLCLGNRSRSKERARFQARTCKYNETVKAR